MSIVQRDYTVADILTLSFLACSIISCALVCIHYLVKKSGLSDTADRLLFCLACSDLVGAGMWFLDINMPGILCPYSGAINMFGYQAAQFWTCIIGAYLIITCSAKQPPAEIIFYIIAWGVPILVQVIVLSLHLYHVNPAPHGCWVKYGSIQIAFVTLPQMVCGVLNLLFLGTIIYKMRISAKRWGLQSRDRGLFFVMLCFLVTTVSGILESIHSRNDDLYVVAVCFGGLQGFFNSIAMKQKAILLFLGQVKTKIRPPQPRTARPLPSYSSMPNSTTWLLQDDHSSPSSPSPTSSTASSASSSSFSSIPRPHPAITDSYGNYYTRSLNNTPSRMTTLPSSSAPSSAHPAVNSDNYSMSSFPASNL